MEDRRTKAQILRELEAAEIAAQRLSEENEALKANAPRPIKRAPEVVALDECVRAIGALRPSQNVYSYRTDDHVAWVINALADRFNVSRMTTVCDRPHLEEF